jgi:hypothetical protein
MTPARTEREPAFEGRVMVVRVWSSVPTPLVDHEDAVSQVARIAAQCGALEHLDRVGDPQCVLMPVPDERPSGRCRSPRRSLRAKTLELALSTRAAPGRTCLCRSH